MAAAAAAAAVGIAIAITVTVAAVVVTTTIPRITIVVITIITIRHRAVGIAGVVLKAGPLLEKEVVGVWEFIECKEGVMWNLRE